MFWHQDNAYWQCAPATLVSCWLTLDDVSVDNGAMQVIPGSHRQALEHEKSGSTSALLDNAERVDSSQAVAIELPAGGAMLHHCQTFHYTAPNNTSRERRAFAIHFMTPGTKSRRTGEHLAARSHARCCACECEPAPHRPPLQLQLRSAGRWRSSSRMALAQELWGSTAR